MLGRGAQVATIRVKRPAHEKPEHSASRGAASFFVATRILPRKLAAGEARSWRGMDGGKKRDRRVRVARKDVSCYEPSVAMCTGPSRIRKPGGNAE